MCKNEFFSEELSFNILLVVSVEFSSGTQFRVHPVQPCTTSFPGPFPLEYSACVTCNWILQNREVPWVLEQLCQAQESVERQPFQTRTVEDINKRRKRETKKVSSIPKSVNCCIPGCFKNFRKQYVRLIRNQTLRLKQTFDVRFDNLVFVLCTKFQSIINRNTNSFSQRAIQTNGF